MSIHLTVTKVWFDSSAPFASVVRASGRLDDHGNTVEFGGDWRPMSTINDALARGEDVQVEIEDWQVLSMSNDPAFEETP